MAGLANILFDTLFNVPFNVLFFWYNGQLIDNRKKRMCFIIIMVTACSLLVFLDNMKLIHKLLRALINFIFLSVSVIFFVDSGKRIKSLCFATLNTLAIMIVECVTPIFSMKCFGIHILDVIYYMDFLIVMKIFAYVLYVIIISIILYFWRRIVEKKKEMSYGIFVPLMALQFIAYVYCAVPYWTEKLNLYATILSGSASLLLYGIYFVNIYIVWQIMNVQKEDLKKNMISQQINNQKSREEALVRDMKAAEELRSRILHSIDKAVSFLNEKKGAEAHTCLGNIVEKMEVKYLYSNNKIADAVISEKAKVCREKGIELISRMNLPENIPVENAEICIILANLLDNAIRACEKCENPVIRITAVVRNGYEVIRQENSFDGTVENRRSGALPEHGLGLEIVENIAQKYEGGLMTECREGMFVTVVTVKM